MKGGEKMESVLTTLGEVTNFVLDTCGDVINTVTSNPILLIGFATALLSGAVGLFKRLS